MFGILYSFQNISTKTISICIIWSLQNPEEKACHFIVFLSVYVCVIHGTEESGVQKSLVTDNDNWRLSDLTDKKKVAGYTIQSKTLYELLHLKTAIPISVCSLENRAHFTAPSILGSPVPLSSTRSTTFPPRTQALFSHPLFPTGDQIANTSSSILNSQSP
jgi:hypothetical protein